MKAAAFTRLPCPLPGIDIVRADTARTFPRHVHDEFGIGLIDRGAQKSASGRGQVEAGAGDLITVNPGEVHDGLPIDDRGRAWRMLYLSPDVVRELATDLRDHRGPPSGDVEFHRPTLRDPRIATRFEALFHAMTVDVIGAGADDVDAAAAGPTLQADEALLLLLQGLLLPRAPMPTAIPAGIALARARLDDELASPVSLADLAREAGLSRFQFLRGFTLATGLPPHAYLVQRRLQRARRLIGLGTPLAEAAAASGFYDQSHLTRHFVRCFGIAPGAYAAAMR
ncbi:AraC family transcriptional regulator [Mitsuaria sp. GD03876]|uniref:AraC family transcriptional regulator n=1 Tax=Mitsuaria sp. GD03876 TaxID=2975399 RepID=UPI0024469747|nr:AraC family transcriptional regulator [Mitsuaria sp. GD03876]MDH0864716.1 AraC family transcriptional regulator [Mitsuaria sp. GD03876]